MLGFGKKEAAPQSAPKQDGWEVLGSSASANFGSLNADGSVTVEGNTFTRAVLERVSPLALWEDQAIEWVGDEFRLLLKAVTTACRFSPERLWATQRRPPHPNLPMVAATGWKLCESVSENGPLKFLPGGMIERPDGKQIDQTVQISAELGNATIAKKAGPGEEFLIQAPSVTHAHVFLGGRWFYQRRQTR